MLLIIGVIAIVAVVVLAVVAIAFFASLNHATVTINVTNNESSSVDITVTSNMRHVATNLFAPGETRTYEVTESFWGASHSVFISASVVGGSGFDSTTITVFPGGHYTVNLFV